MNKPKADRPSLNSRFSDLDKEILGDSMLNREFITSND